MNNKFEMSYDKIFAAIVIVIVIVFSCVVAIKIANDDPKARGEVNSHNNTYTVQAPESSNV